MRMKLLLFSWIFAISIGSFSSFANQEMADYQKDSKTNCIKLYEKMDFLIEKVEKLETNAFKECAACDEDKSKVSVAQILNAFEGHFAKTDKIEKLLFQLIDQKCNSDGVRNLNVSELPSKCESIVKNWEKETKDQLEEKLKKLELCFKSDTQKNLNLCKPNPCLNGGRCVLTSAGSDYQCAQCPYPTSGKNCQYVNCEKSNKCIQRNDTVYVVFESHMPWINAYEKCVSEGMSLIMPKDKETNDFVINQLRSIYGANERIRYFWSGLKYNVNEKQWQWIDGSALGAYTGGKADFKIHTGHLCGDMFLFSGDSMWWPYDCTAASPHYLLYPLCEKRLLMG